MPFPFLSSLNHRRLAVGLGAATIIAGSILFGLSSRNPFRRETVRTYVWPQLHVEPNVSPRWSNHDAIPLKTILDVVFNDQSPAIGSAYPPTAGAGEWDRFPITLTLSASVGQWNRYVSNPAGMGSVTSSTIDFEEIGALVDSEIHGVNLVLPAHYQGDVVITCRFRNTEVTTKGGVVRTVKFSEGAERSFAIPVTPYDNGEYRARLQSLGRIVSAEPPL